MVKLSRRIDGIPVVASTTERDVLFPTPERDQRVLLRDSGQEQRYDGTAWRDNPTFYASQRAQGVRWASDPAYGTFAAALAAASAGEQVVLAESETLTSGVTIDKAITIAAFPRAVLEVAAGSNFVALTISNTSNVRFVGDIRIQKASGAALGVASRALVLSGTVTDVDIDRLTVEAGFYAGIDIGAGGDTDTSGTRPLQRIRMTARVTGTTGTFGINVDDAEDVDLVACYAHECWLDGFKIRKNTRNVRIIGGSSRENGQSYIGGGGNAGDGIDAYSGGHTLTIANFNASENNGNGVIIKTDSIQQGALADIYGTPQQVQVTNLVACRNAAGSGGSGLGFYVNNNADTTLEVPQGCVVTGGIFNENAGNGIYADGLNIKLFGTQAHKNGSHNYNIKTRSIDVELHGCSGYAAGHPDAAGTPPVAAKYNVYVGGKHVRIFGGTFRGVWPEGVFVEGDLAGLTKYSDYNIYVDGISGAEDVDVFHPIEGQALNTRGVVVTGTPSRVCLHLRAASNPTGGAGQTGGIGSTYINTATTGPDTFWRKTSGDANTTSGWERGHVGAAIYATGTTLAFHGATAVAKQTITGSRGGNAALADLLTKLATLGLITDSTSA